LRRKRGREGNREVRGREVLIISSGSLCLLVCSFIASYANVARDPVKDNPGSLGVGSGIGAHQGFNRIMKMENEVLSRAGTGRLGEAGDGGLIVQKDTECR
jgi:hypothetical protein